MPVVSTENVSVFIPLILRGKVSGSGAPIYTSQGGIINLLPKESHTSNLYEHMAYNYCACSVIVSRGRNGWEQGECGT